MKNKFRASYSILNTWASGNYDMAIKYYFKLDTFVTPAMVDGRKYHETWATHINNTLRLPEEFGKLELKKPQTELKKVVQITDWLELVGIIDCYDDPTIYEFKTGKQSSESYASSMQPAVYGVLATMSGLYVDRAVIHHYDQHRKKSDNSYIWLTDKVLNDGLNWIETLASEMHNYLEQNKLYERFEKSKKSGLVEE